MAEVPESGVRASGADEPPIGASTVAPATTDRDATPSLAVCLTTPTLGIDNNLYRPAARPASCLEGIDVDALGLRVAGAEALAAHVGADFDFGQLAVGGVDRFAGSGGRSGKAGTTRFVEIDVPDEPSQVGR